MTSGIIFLLGKQLTPEIAVVAQSELVLRAVSKAPSGFCQTPPWYVRIEVSSTKGEMGELT
jgi:hypothetical protein